jgi:hypothetical protein
MPFEQTFEQHSPPKLHLLPSGEHGGLPQMPFEQTFEQHSPPKLHLLPSGEHGGLPQMPFEQTLEQHSPPKLHPKPSGVHVMHCGLPQTWLTSPTQMLSHELLQQKLSNWQIAVTHGSHPDISAGPTVHRSWAHGPVTPQTPLLQVPLQHCAPTLHMPPSGEH